MRSNERAWIQKGAVIATAALMAKFILKQSRELDLNGKTVLVTGSSRGLGLLLAREFVRRGAHVAICARSDDELQRAQSELGRINTNVRVLRIACDLTQQEEAENLVRSVHQEFGHIDVLINNAGTIQVAPLEEMEISDFEEAMKTNLWAAIYVTLAALPDMRQRGIGRIVNISSIGGLLSVPHLLPYCCSKFALTGFSEGLHTEVARDGIVVTTVCPGLMRTGSARNAHFKGKHRAEY